MNYLIVFHSGSEICEFEVSGGKSAEIDSSSVPNGFAWPGEARFSVSAEEVGLHVVSSVPINVGGVKSLNRMMSAGDVAYIGERLSLSVFERVCDERAVISLEGLSEVTIGRSNKNDICLRGPQVSSRHATLRAAGDGWLLEDSGSRNGTFIGGSLVASVVLAEGAIIFMGGWKIVFHENTLIFGNTAGSAAFSPKLRVTLPPPMAVEAKYPLFQRSPRLKPEAGVLEVDILPPPNAGSRPAISWFSALLPPAMMILVMLLIAALMRNPMTLYYTIPMSGVSIVVAIVNYRDQVKKWCENRKFAADKYVKYLCEKEAEITAAEADCIKTAVAVNPDLKACARVASRVERRLWERTPSDGDFLEIRLGAGQVPSNVKVKIPQNTLSLEEDPLLEEARKLKERHAVLSGIPVTHSFCESTITGLAGDREGIRQLAWGVISSVAVHHSYEDVKIVCVYPESESRAWEWVRWLPHTWNSDRTKRFIASTKEDAYPLLREIGDLLKSRCRSLEDERGGHPLTPFYFLILADKHLTEDSGESLLPETSRLGVTALYAYGDISLLPSECQAIISCSAELSLLHVKARAASGISFTPELASRDMMDEFARNLAPVRLRSTTQSVAMPSYITFMQGYAVDRVEELDVLGRWARNKPFRSIAAPIGVKENGELFHFDIHEKGMGPHGIVAGATRWGKSETLTTWLLSVALNFPPHEVSFVLIDFKGDGLSGILLDLPHVAGIISNVNDITSIERNLRSLQGELLRRQRVFMETKFENIHKYQEAYREGKVSEPMAYLIIVIDEFAELKTQFPDQMNGFISVARVGGSLGVYMVLATQSPGGIVAGQVSANSRFRICLKTSEAGESREILGTTDAFRITARGRAYVKVGNNEVYELVQTFYSKAPYQPVSGHKGPSTKINIVAGNGERLLPEVYDKTIGASGGDAGEGRAVAHYIKDAAASVGSPGARLVWADAMPERIFLSSVITGREAFRDGAWAVRNKGFAVIAGLVDDPENQRQYPLVLDFAEDGHQVLYGAPSSGKTTFLRTVLLSAALSYTPDQLQFLVLDFGTWGMKIFENLPHTLLVADANDAEKVKQAELYMASELASRKKRFAEQGVGTLEAYREITGENVPSVLIAIDNMAALHGMYPDMLDSLMELAREGGGLGLYLIITAGNQGSFMYRIAQYIKVSYALQLTDKSDYRQLVGGNGRQEPAHFPGRGFAKGPLEFQTALCVDGERESERVRQLRDICGAMDAAWKGTKPVIHAGIGEIDADALAVGYDYVQIGIDKDTASPYGFAFAEMNGCVISGPRGCGKTNMLGWIILGLSEDPGTRIYVYEKSSALPAVRAEMISVDDGAEFDGFLAKLAEEYDRRTESGSSFPRVALCIDDFVKFFEEISDEGARMLDVIINYGGEYGMYVYIAGEMEGLMRFYNQAARSPLVSCLSNGNAIAIGGRLKEHAIFNRLHDEDDFPLSEHEACVLHGKRVWRVRLAKARNGGA